MLKSRPCTLHTLKCAVLTSEKIMVEGVVEALVRDGDVVRIGREKYAMKE